MWAVEQQNLLWLPQTRCIKLLSPQWPSKQCLDNRERKIRLCKRRANAKLFLLGGAFLMSIFTELITTRATNRRRRSKLHNMFWIADECHINFSVIKSIKIFASFLCQIDSFLHQPSSLGWGFSIEIFWSVRMAISTSFNRHHDVDKLAKIFPSSESIFIVGSRTFFILPTRSLILIALKISIWVIAFLIHRHVAQQKKWAVSCRRCSPTKWKSNQELART